MQEILPTLLTAVPTGLLLSAGLTWLLPSRAATIWGSSITLAWLAMMAGLLIKDTTWEVGEAPAPPAIDDIPSGYTENFTFFSEKHDHPPNRIGELSIWHQLRSSEGQQTVSSRLTVEQELLPGLGTGARLVISNQTRRKADGRLDGFETEVFIGSGRFKISGTVTAGFCLARLEIPGLSRKPTFRFPVDDRSTEIAQQFSQAGMMPGLRVGQSWQVRVIDVRQLLISIIQDGRTLRSLSSSVGQPPSPKSKASPGSTDNPDNPGSTDNSDSDDALGRRFRRSQRIDPDEAPIELAKLPFEDHIATVVGESEITWHGRRYAVLVVEQHRASSRLQVVRSYVDRTGRVLRQESDGFGSRLSMVREPELVGPCVLHRDRLGVAYLVRDCAEAPAGKVHFCGKACRARWDELTEAERAAALVGSRE